ncbi:MAG: 4-hydroxy-3-methylbut-2-enyl diphosphate reductase, partial [Clostridia bacterium]|nr:4-hydroxy-3-methylbut-2-enyl diphosphate reductase [Clostridia bacterium]
MIKVAKEAGFCPGVRRADGAVMRLINNKTENDLIFTLGKLIHNDIYNSELKAKGANVIDIDELRSTLKDLTDKSVYVLIRTHGITKEVGDELDELKRIYPNLKVEDMTCPFVKRIHKIAEEHTTEDTFFLLFGHKTHPETIGILSYAAGEKQVISSLEELETVKIGTKLPILVAQTTQNLYEFKKIKKFLKKLYTNAKIFDTICSVTENRQNEAVRLAMESEAMIVIGG